MKARARSAMDVPGRAWKGSKWKAGDVMSHRLKIAVRLLPGADGTAADTPEQARYAERLGLDGIFVGDHLKPAAPYPESLVVLAAVRAAPQRS